MAVQAEALNGGVEDWQLTVTSTALGGQCVMLSQTEKPSVIYAATVNERVTYVDPLAVADLLPDGLYGLLLGTTVGVAEGKQYLEESQLRLSMLTTAMEMAGAHRGLVFHCVLAADRLMRNNGAFQFKNRWELSHYHFVCVLSSSELETSTY